MQLFFKKYGSDYNHEDIIKATEKYVKSFNGDYSYMKVLKYFILKEKLGAGRDVESESELLTNLENLDHVDDEYYNDVMLELK